MYIYSVCTFQQKFRKLHSNLKYRIIKSMNTIVLHWKRVNSHYMLIVMLWEATYYGKPICINMHIKWAFKLQSLKSKICLDHLEAKEVLMVKWMKVPKNKTWRFFLLLKSKLNYWYWYWMLFLKSIDLYKQNQKQRYLGSRL